MSFASAFLGLTILQLFLEFDSIDESGLRVLQDDQLVSNDAIDDLLLLIFGNVINVAGFMKLSLAATVTFLAV